MPTPTEPGWYWWTRTEPPNDAEIGDDRWVPSPQGIPVVVFVGNGCETVAFPACEIDILFVMMAELGEWGQRIPSLERLAALEAVAAVDPHAGGDWCPHCQAYSTDDPPHRASCVWLRAQEARDADAD